MTYDVFGGTLNLTHSFHCYITFRQARVHVLQIGIDDVLPSQLSVNADSISPDSKCAH